MDLRKNPHDDTIRAEFPDATPCARPVHFQRRMSTLDEVRRALGVITREAEERGIETFEEADDFDVGDDYDPTSPWELSADQEHYTPPLPSGTAAPVPTPAPQPGNPGAGSPPGVPPVSSPPAAQT